MTRGGPRAWSATESVQFVFGAQLLGESKGHEHVGCLGLTISLPSIVALALLKCSKYSTHADDARGM